MRYVTRFASSVLALSIASASVAQTVDSTTIFIVDESGSMGGEHSFLQTFVSDVDAALQSAGLATNNFGLVGYGNGGSMDPRLISVGGANVGNAADFAVAASGLVLSGAFEDGYQGIDFALDNYNLSNVGNVTFVLVTDEDRDIADASLTLASITSALGAASVSLVTVLDIDITDGNGATAIATDGTNAFVQDGSTFTTNSGFTLTNPSFETMIEDYANLALGLSGGCVADLNQLRSAGTAATAFAAAFETCLVNAATTGGGTTTVVILLDPIRDATLSIAENIRAQLRDLANQANSGSSGTVSSQGKNIIDDVFEIEGLRGYAFISGGRGVSDTSEGDVDLTGRALTLGADYTTGTNGNMLRFGAALSRGTSTTDGGGTSSDGSANSINLYGLYRTAGGFQAVADASFSNLEFSISRDGVANSSGDTDGTYRTFGLEFGQRFEVGSQSDILMPFIGFERTSLDIDSYTEGNGTRIAGFTETVTFASLGLRYEMERMIGENRFFAETMIAATRAIDDDVDIDAVVLADTEVTDFESTRFDLGVTMGIETGNGSRALLTASATRNDDLRYGTIGLGMEWRF